MNSIGAKVISRLRIVGAGGEIADALTQGNGMLAHNRPPIMAGRPQIWLELPQPDTGLLRCFRRSENEGSPEICDSITEILIVDRGCGPDLRRNAKGK